MRRLPQQQRNPRVRRQRDTAALRRQVVLLACGLTVTLGFVVSVGQQYAAVRYGYASEKLREERKTLLAEHERLLLELSAAESPVTLERAAREIGMQPARPSQIEATRRSATPQEAADGSSDARDAAASPGKRTTKAETAGARAAKAGAATDAGTTATDAGAASDVLAASKRRRGADEGRASDGGAEDGRPAGAGAGGGTSGAGAGASGARDGATSSRGDSRPRIVRAAGKGR
jgi:cell division protein FtsL